ncbi:hypothetical protein GCM10027446_25510 [Angustibacter peucedani]
MSAYEVDAATMCDALSHVPGVEHVVLEFDERGNGVLRVQVSHGQDHASVVGAAVTQMRSKFGLGVDQRRLRLTGPAGRPVVAVVETLDDGALTAADAPAGAAEAHSAELEVAPEELDVRAPELVEELVDERAGTTDLTAALSAAPPELRHPAAGRHRPFPLPEPEEQRSPRVVVERVVVSTERQEVRASVQLRLGAALHEGIASRPATGSGAHRALAAATASAVEAVVSTSARLEVDQVDLLQVGPDHIAVVVLSLLTSQGIDRLTGSALVRSDARDAVVRATLDALNRRAGIVGPQGGAAA